MLDTLRRRDLLVGVGSATAATVAGTGGLVLTDRATASTDDENDEPARVRVAHASPDAPNVDVLIDGERRISNIPFRAVTDYLSLGAGSYDVSITAAGDPDTVAFEGEVSFETDTDYTITAIGELSEDTFRPTALVDADDVDDDEVGVRVVHALPDALAVDITTADSRTTLVDDLSFGTATEFVGVDPGVSTLEVKPESTGDDNPFDAEFEVELSPAQLYSFIATGYFTADDEPSKTRFTLIPAVTDQGD